MGPAQTKRIAHADDLLTLPVRDDTTYRLREALLLVAQTSSEPERTLALVSAGVEAGSRFAA